MSTISLWVFQRCDSRSVWILSNAFGLIPVCSCGLLWDLISVLLFIPVLVKNARLGSNPDRKAMQLVSRILRLICLSFPWSHFCNYSSQFMLHVRFAFRNYCARALTLRQPFVRFAFIGAYVHIPCSHVLFVTSLLSLCIHSRFDAVVRRASHRHL